jgi:hypothetical protein
MADMTQPNGWNEYSKLVLKELETLATGIAGLKHEMQDLKQEMTELRLREDKIRELRDWKEKVDDVVSPTRLKDVVKDVEEMKIFKTKAVTIFAVVQFIVMLTIALMRYL